MDTNFLGGDILDEEHQLRPGQGGVDPAVFNLADAVILGNIGDDTSSFETSDSGFHLKQEMGGAARLYVSGRSQAVMSPDAVIALIDKEGVRLTPFEKHLLRFIDGKRPVEVIRRQTGLDEAEVKTALATLADKGVVKVVGRALADAADFDTETAPGNVPKGKPRRMRGTLVGAVVVVGDAADQAIDDAFRTQVRADVRPDPNELIAADDGPVFTAGSDSLPQADSADINSFDIGGTDEVVARGGRLMTSSTSTVRPASLRHAVNAGGRTNARGSAPVLSDVDASDGFDEFGVPSDVATAMVQQPSLSDESSLPGVDPMTLRPAGGVFADPAASSGRGLSDLEDFDAPGVDDLADSRVEPRPDLQSLTGSPRPRAAPPAVPSLSEASDLLGSSSEASLNEEERAAFSGGVWDDVDADGGATNIREPPPGASGLRSELSTSLSALLGSSEDDDALAEPGPTTPGRMADALPPREPAGFDSDEEPTGLRDPPPVMVRPPAASRPVRPTKPPARPMAPPPPMPSSVDGAGIEEEDPWESSTPRALPSQKVGAAPRARPPSMPMVEARDPAAGAADELFPDDDDDFVGATEARPGPMTAPAPKSDGLSTGILPERRVLDATLPPSQADLSSMLDPDDPADDGDSAWSSSDGAGRRAQPAEPEPSRFDSRAQESLSRGEADARGPTALIEPMASSSAEILDSNMVIRPAIKAVPLAIAARKARTLAVAPTPPNSDEEVDEEDFMVDPDATLNLPAQPKSKEGEARRKAKRAPEPEAPVAQAVMAEPDGAASAPNRRAPTEDMRRKARNLFEQAQEDHAVGRLGAARMNAKLATIYDPENDRYRQILADWERPSSGTGGSNSRPEYVVLYEEAQEREDEDDVDGALTLLEKGMRLAPNPAAFHNRIGVILAMRKRDFERAKDEIQKAIALEPDNPHYRNNLGKVMSKANRRRGDAVANAR